MKKKVSVLWLTISCILVFFITSAFYPRINAKKTASNLEIGPVDCANSMDQIRLKNYRYIQPLVLSDINNENPALQPMRVKIEEYISEVKSILQAEDISVYFRKLNDGSWFCINPNKSYNPASLSKVIYLITFLKEAENNPAILNKKVFFSHHYSEGNQQNIKDFSLIENAYYTISDLLNFMIIYSDNDATQLLTENLNKDIFNQVFADLNIPVPPEFGEYFITPSDYSKFFRVLYNASYIRPALSETGLKLLTLSTFKDGLRKGVDSTVAIAHKFGERTLGNKSQLHEFGIVFIKGDPYLIGVMTSGSSLIELEKIVGEISRITYSELTSAKAI